MPRPCQQRRASAAAQRKPKPAEPLPIRHKARQKAIHNARRGHSDRRGRGSGNMAGGQPSRHQQSGNEVENAFISFTSTGNNFHNLSGSGSQYDPIALEESDDSGFDSDDMDLDMYDAQDMMINLQVNQSTAGKGQALRAEVMFTIPDALVIYNALWQAGFPLPRMDIEKYGLQEGDASSASASHMSLAPSPASHGPSASSTATVASLEGSSPGFNYVFSWGRYSGKHFLDVPENYLRTIGGQLDIFEAKYPGLREAFQFYRPGYERTATAPQKRSQPQPSQSRQPAPIPSHNTRSSARSPSETYTFKKGAFKGKKLGAVPESYLRGLEGMKHVVDNWPGLKEALQDFNKKTGRPGRPGIV